MTSTVSESEAQQQERLAEAGRRMIAMTDALAEAGVTITDLLLQADSVGFERIGAAFGTQADMLPPERRATVRQSRLYWQREPMNDSSTATWTDQAFGRHWRIMAKDEAFQEIIDSILRSRANRKQFSRQGWRKSSDTLLVDGECVWAFFPGVDTVKVRKFETLEIDDVLTNPEDKDEVWYYRRTYIDADGKPHTRFYRDWDFVDASGEPRNDPHPRMQPGKLGALSGDIKYTPEDNVWVTILAINTLGIRGYPMFTSSLPWQREVREFEKDRTSLSRARAQFAFKATVRGGQNAVDAVKGAFETPDAVDTTTGLRNPRAGAWVGNEGIALEQFSGSTDGPAANADRRGLRQLALAAGRIPEYFYDVSTGNLATAQAMERPLETMFAAYQDLWVEWMQDMFEHFGEWLDFKGDTTVDIDPPAILARNIGVLMGAVVQLAQVYPAVAESPEVLAMLLTEIGLNNVDEVMTVLEPLLGAAPDTADAGAATREALAIVREAARRAQVRG